MKANFWHSRWENKNIGFHLDEVNPKLTAHFNALNLKENSRVFVPLCGKTRDLNWMLSQGMQVVGSELSSIAVEEFFSDLGVTPVITQLGELNHYKAEHIEIFQGDIFALSHESLGPIDAIYDRAALVALPLEMRKRYTQHLIETTKSAPQLLICFEYDQSQMSGPPFSIDDDEVKTHYAQTYELMCLSRSEIPGGLKGKCKAEEKVWIIQSL